MMEMINDDAKCKKKNFFNSEIHRTVLNLDKRSFLR